MTYTCQIALVFFRTTSVSTRKISCFVVVVGTAYTAGVEGVVRVVAGVTADVVEMDTLASLAAVDFGPADLASCPLPDVFFLDSYWLVALLITNVATVIASFADTAMHAVAHRARMVLRWVIPGLLG